MLSWLAFAAVGKVLIFVWQKFQFPFKNEWLEKIHDCPLCSGVWIYSVLAVGFNVDIFADFFRSTIISQVSTGILTSYLVWVFVAGWKSLHEEVIVI